MNKNSRFVPKDSIFLPGMSAEERHHDVRGEGAAAGQRLRQRTT